MRILTRLAAVAGLVVAGGLALPGGAAQAAACSGTSGVTVVIDYGSSTTTSCASGDPSSAMAALKAVATVVSPQRYPGTVVCRINGNPASDPCIQMPPASAYWAFYHAPRGGSWTYSQVGVAGYNPAPGTAVGFAFGAGATPGTPPPAAAPKASPKPSPSSSSSSKPPATKPKPKPSSTSPSSTRPTPRGTVTCSATAPRRPSRARVPVRPPPPHPARRLHPRRRPRRARRPRLARRSSNPTVTRREARARPPQPRPTRRTDRVRPPPSWPGSAWWGWSVPARHTSRSVAEPTPSGAVRAAGTPLSRHLHPVAWWVWAIGLAVACSRTTNPLLLLLAVSVACLVVAAKRGSSPWARAFRLYLVLGAFIIVLRVVLHVLVGSSSAPSGCTPCPASSCPASPCSARSTSKASSRRLPRDFGSRA